MARIGGTCIHPRVAGGGAGEVPRRLVALHRWEPWAYAQQAGILKKWADKYKIEIELTLVNDYVESINLYTSGKFDACAMTNMDALTIPAVGGVDSTVLIVGDFSNGNDGIVLKNGKDVKALKGRSVKLVEFTVSHYMLARALEMNGMTEKDVKTREHERLGHRRPCSPRTPTPPWSRGIRRCSR
jgi:ABC transporter binding protein (urea carboxylase system)